jgi:hypothetical protein
VSGIAEQRKIEFLLDFEGGEGLFGVRAGAQDGDTGSVELRFCVTKLGRFGGSTGSVGLGKEEEEDALTFEILERDFPAIVGFEKEVGGFGA